MRRIEDDLLDDENGEHESGVETAALEEEWAEAGLLDAMDEIVATFLDDTSDQLLTLEEHAEDGNCGGAARVGHALKSAAGSLHAKRLAELFKQIEAAGKTGDIGTVRALVPEATQEFARVRVSLTARPAA